MAVRTDFTAGEVLAAADLNDTFLAKLNVAGGKILQIVRATDATQRTTSSTSYVDVTGMSVTITPQKNNSAILLIASFMARITLQHIVRYQITDASNNAISGANEVILGTVDYTTTGTPSLDTAFLMTAWATPATLSATTYKLRFNVSNAAGTGFVRGNVSTSQMFALEVSA
jgi:hypothetical protein